MVRGENSLFFATGLDNSGLKRGIFDAENLIGGLARKISKINPFAALAVGAASVFAVVAKEAFDFAKRYEQAMLEVRTISKSTQADFKGTSGDIFSLSEKTLDDPIKLSRAYYQIVSAGYDGAEGLRLLEVASKAATAGVTDTQTAADGITTVLNAFGESAENADNVADAMFKTVELGKTTFDQLSSTLSTTAPLASALGVSYNEILAAVASLTKQGVPTAQAMTQIRAALIGVNKVLGDGWSNAYTFQEAMEEVAKRSNRSTTELQKSTGTIEAVGAILATTGKNAEGAAKDLEALEKSSGSAERAFRVMASGQINQMQILKNRIKAVTEELGDKLLGAANSAAGALLKLSDSGSFAGEQYQKEREALKDLKIELESASSSTERRKEIIDDLKAKYPAYLKDIENEGILTQELRFALTDVNEQLLRRFQLAGNQEELQEIALEIGEKEKKQRKDIIQLEDDLSKIQSSAFHDRIRYLETQQGRELSYLEKSEVAFKLLGKNVAGIGQQFNEVRESGKRLTVLRSQFKELTGQADDLNSSINDFKVKETAADLESEGEKELSTYREFLKKRADEYKAFQNQIVQLGRDRAEEINADLLKSGKTYRQFLEQQLKDFKGASDKEKDIAEAAEKAGFRHLSLSGKPQKLTLDILPQVQDIKLSENAISKLIRKLEKEVEESGALSAPGALSDIAKVAERELQSITKVNAIKKLKLKELAKYEGKLTEETFKVRTEAIQKQNKKDLEAIKRSTNELLKEISQSVFDEALLGIDLSFDNLNDATLGQLGEIEKKLKSIAVDSEDLMDLGLDPAQVSLVLKFIEDLKAVQGEAIDTAQSANISDSFANIGNIFSQAGDEFTQKLGGVVSALGQALATVSQDGGFNLQKASSWVGLIIQAGNIMTDIGEEDYFADINAQKEVNAQLAEQLSAERKINEIRRERAEIERNSSAFLDSFYKDDFTAALRKQSESEKELNESMAALAENGVFTAEGIGKRLLFGKKKENRDFSIDQILGDFNLQGFFESTGQTARSRFFDPLSIFGGFSDINVSKDALKKLRNEFEVTIKAMGRTTADMANFSSEEWLDFFTVMEENGKIVDEGTKRLLENAQDSLQQYNEAVEEMRGIIQDFAGSLGNDLADALVFAFEEGGDAADRFKESINDIINQLFLQQLIDSQFRSYFDELQKDMEASFRQDGDQSWIDDIQKFADGVTPAMDQALAAMNAFNEEIQAQGYSGFGSSDVGAKGLSGSISTITEDTASILAGTLNAIRTDMIAGLSVAKQNSAHLINITRNTAETVIELKSSNARLSNIETLLQ